jgi:hypothetical protein
MPSSASRQFALLILVMVLPKLMVPSLVRAQARGDGLNERASAFLRLVKGAPGEFRPYFPRSGEMRYVHTIHASTGDRVEVLRLGVSDVERDLATQSALFDALEASPEHQTVGVLVEQVNCRGTGWRRIAGTRFVPPGEGRSSPVFIEWRREGQRWVIGSIGDESFEGDARPTWECKH